MSEVKVNKLSPRSGTTVTLGDSGDTFTVPSGVTFDASSGGLAGTLTTAAQPNITSVGTLTSFTSTGIDDNATSTAITINSSEYVGINTTSPQRYLHITGNDGASGTNSGNSDTQLFIDNDGSNGAIIEFGASNTGAGRIAFSDEDAVNRGKLEYLHSTDHMEFTVNGSEAMRINSSGKILVATTSESQGTLTVHSDVDYTTTEFEDNNALTLKNNDFTNPACMVFRSSNSGGSTYRSGITGGWDNSLGQGIAFYGDIINKDRNDDPDVFIRSDGKVGIGATSLDALLVIQGDSDENTTPSIRLKDGSDTREAWITNNAGDLYLTTGGDDNVPHTQLRILNGDLMTFRTANTEAMRIASDQSLFINTTGISTFTTRVGIYQDNTKNCAIHLRTNATASQSQIIFGNGNSDSVGSIATSGTSTAYNTSSDYRLKENVSYDFDATTRLKQLKPARFNFIADADTTVDGFLAHEVSSVVPEAISGEKDATETKEKVVVNANGNVIAENIEQADWEAGKIADEEGKSQYPTDSTWEATKVVSVYQGIDQSKLVPLLVKTIQELEARITTLENA